MKTFLYISAVVAASALVSNAQNKLDASYSAANYKMPHKAAIAKANNQEASNTTTYASGSAQASNYKNNFNKTENAGAEMVALPVAGGTNPMASSANYKNQFRKPASVTPIAPSVKTEPVAIISE